MTESVISLRVSKINGLTPASANCVRALYVYIRPGNRRYSKCICSGSMSLACSKIFKMFFNAIGKQSIIIKLLELEPKITEIAALSIPISWIPREYYIAESFPLRPLIPGIASPIAFVEIQLSSNENALPFTLPPADLIHIPAWRPYPKVELLVKSVSSPNNNNAQHSQQGNLIDFNQNDDQSRPPRFTNDYAHHTSLNMKLKRKRSSSLCFDNVSKLEELMSDKSSSGNEDEYSEESTSAEPAAEYKIYKAFAPPIMRNGMEPSKLEPKLYSDAEFSEILSKHAFSGALLNGQYINPPKYFTKNIPLCDKVNSEKNAGKANQNGGNHPQDNARNAAQQNNDNNNNNNDNEPHRHHRHRHRHYHYHGNANNKDADYKSRSNSRSQKSINQVSPSTPEKDSRRIDQRSNSIQLGGKGFFQKSRMQKIFDIRNSIRPTPPPDYQELQNDILFKDNM